MTNPFWKGFRQGLTWPISCPMTLITYCIGLIGYWIIEHVEWEDETDDKWYHTVTFWLYNAGMRWSVFWNDVGGCSLWGPVKENEHVDP